MTKIVKTAKKAVKKKRLPASKTIKKGKDSEDIKATIIAQLQKIAGIYQAAGEKGKVFGYQRAIRSLKTYEKPICNLAQMDGIEGIGDGIKKKIAEVLKGKSMSKLDELNSDPKMMVLDTLGKVWGVGPVAAQKLYSYGIRSIEDLRKKQDLLTNHQKIGLKYFEDFNLRMPRATATQIEAIVKKAVHSIYGTKVQVQACGSYRRGKSTCGDVDILITRTDKEPVSGMLEPILLKLEKENILHERLGNTRKSNQGSEMYMGVCKAPTDSHYRRIDIKVYPQDQYAFALLYFTGSDIHNRQMRQHAETMGLTLSDHSLVKIGTKTSINCQTEQDIFSNLGLTYKTPSERDI